MRSRSRATQYPKAHPLYALVEGYRSVLPKWCPWPGSHSGKDGVDGPLFFAAKMATLTRLRTQSWKGDAGAWFRATKVRQAGHMEAGGVGKHVTFVAETDDDVNDRIDAAYRTKYRRHGGRYVDPMVAPTARATTIKLVPRSSTS